MTLRSMPALRTSAGVLQTLRSAGRSTGAWLRNLAPPRISCGLALGATSAWLVRIQGSAQQEPCCLAMEGPTLRAVGSAAALLEGRSPPGVRLLWPLRGAQVQQREAAVKLMRHVLRRVGLAGRHLAVAVPTALTAAERRTLEQVLHAAGVVRVYFVNEALVGALGAGLDPMGSAATLVIDVGGDHTSLSVLALGRVIMSRTVAVGSREVESAIVHALEDRHRLRIGRATAERIQHSLGSAEPSMAVDGMSLDSGLPTRVQVNTADLCEALQPLLETLADDLRAILETVPATLLADLLQPGAAALIGPAAPLRGLSDILSQRLHLDFRPAPYANSAVAAGLSLLMHQPALRRLVLLPAPRTATPAPVVAASGSRRLAWALGLVSALLVWQLSGTVSARTTTVDRNLTAMLVPAWATAARFLSPPLAAHPVDPAQRMLLTEVQSDRRQLAALSAQNHHLRALLHLRKRWASERSVVGEVVARDPAAWLQTMMVDVGKNGGAAPGMLAIADNSLVGQVSDVGPTSSRLQTLTGKGATVSGLVAHRKAAGVVYGVDGRTCEMRYLDPSSGVRVGDLVTTSGEDRCPPGLAIGRITQLHPGNDGVSLVAVVRPSASLDTVREVLLMQGQHR